MLLWTAARRRNGWRGDAASAPRGSEGLSNQDAAMPSLHVGWAVWVALCLMHHTSRRWLRRAVWVYPAVMAFVVMATANHYLLDVVGGVACAVAGTWLARRLDRRRSRDGQPSAGSRSLANSRISSPRDATPSLG